MPLKIPAIPFRQQTKTEKNGGTPLQSLAQALKHATGLHGTGKYILGSSASFTSPPAPMLLCRSQGFISSMGSSAGRAVSKSRSKMERGRPVEGALAISATSQTGNRGR